MHDSLETVRRAGGAMEATLLMKKEHEALREMLDRMAKPSRSNDKVGHLEEIRREMEMHRRIEEELFYPELINTSSTQASALVQQAIERHGEIERLFREVIQ